MVTEPDGVVEVEDPRRPGRRQLADAVADHGVRLHPQGGQQLHQPDLQGEVRGLRDLRPVEPRLILRSRELVRHRPALERPQPRVAGLDRRPEHLARREQLATHPPRLRAHAGKDEHQAAIPPGRRPPHRDRGVAREGRSGARVRAQRRDRLGRVLGHHGQPVRQVRAPPGGRRSDLRPGQPRAGRARQRISQRGGLPGQGSLRAGRDHQQGRPARAAGRVGRHRVRGRLLQHHVGVGAAVPEGAHAGQPRLRGARPGPAGRQLQAVLGERDRRVRPLPVREDVGRHLPVVQAERGLHEPGHAGCPLEVPEVGLQRADRQPLIRRAPGAQHRAQGGRLDRIAHRGAGAVRLDVADRARIDPRGPVRLPQQGLLRDLRRHRDPGRGVPVLVDRGRAHERVDPRAAAPGGRQRLQHHHGGALAPAVAVGGRREGLAPPIGGQHPGLAQGDDRVRVHHHVHATGQGQRALARPQAGAGQVDGHQGRRAGGVDAQRRSPQIEGMRQPRRQHRQAGAGRRVDVHLRAPERAGLVEGVIDHEATHEDAGGRSGQRVGRLPRVLQRLPGHLEQEPLLRIHPPGLARRHREELGVELVDRGLQEAARAHVDLARASRVRMEEPRRAPAVLRHRPRGLAPRRQQPPQRVGLVGPSRQAATDADDGQGFAIRSGRRHWASLISMPRKSPSTGKATSSKRGARDVNRFGR